MDSRFKIIFKCITGSKLYGTDTLESDEDIRGVFIPTKEFYLGFLNKVEQVESHVPDETFWEISKFFRLCIDNNPNILELLFVPLFSKYDLYHTEEWEKIILNRNLFLSTKAQHTFSGYAFSQLHRIKQHREWLLNPSKKHPERKDFGLPETNVVTRDQLNAYEELKNIGESNYVFTEQLLDVLHREKAYVNAMKYWDNYQAWQKNRNLVRAKKEGKFGYDVKHASHLFRLISEGKELLLTGKITFPRPDAKELLDIRNGKYSYNELMEKISDIETVFKEYAKKAILPHSPNIKAAGLLCQELIENRIKEL